jgi:hypothetical protein
MKKTRQKTTRPVLHKETLWHLQKSEMWVVVGGARIWRPSGYAEDTTPIGEWVDDTNP